jgi:hypothetical protein
MGKRDHNQDQTLASTQTFKCTRVLHTVDNLTEMERLVGWLTLISQLLQILEWTDLKNN